MSAHTKFVELGNLMAMLRGQVKDSHIPALRRGGILTASDPDLGDFGCMEALLEFEG